jgi:hypothetical protein
MKLTDYFDAVRVINLPARADRRRAITRELARGGMPLEPGRVELFAAVRPEGPGGFPSLGARGCFLSHLAALRQARDAGRARLLLIEDDLQIAPDLAAVQDALVDQLRAADWGFVYFGHALDLEPTPTHSPVLRRHDGPIGLTHFYGVNGPVLDRLVAYLESVLTRPPGHPDGGPMYNDGALSMFRARNPDVVTLVARPSLGRQRASRSDIADARWFDRLPVVNALVEAARSGKSWVVGRGS